MRILRTEKSFLKKNSVHLGKLLTVVMVFGLLALSLSGCIGSDPQKQIEDSAVTQSPENVARVFAESVFCGNYEKMLTCFPAKYTASLSENDLAQYRSWGEEVKTDLEKNGTEYLGTSSGDSVQISSDKASSDYKDSIASISLAYGLVSTDIEEVRSCNVRVFCNIEKSKQYQDVTILVYKFASHWYACVSAASGTSETTVG